MGKYRVGVAGKKDLYEYWKQNVAKCLVEDLQKGKGGSAKSDSDGFLVVNVASQEVSFETRHRSGRRLLVGRAPLRQQGLFCIAVGGSYGSIWWL